jgi:hypothetical protein
MSGRVDASVTGLPRPLLDGLPAPYSGQNTKHGVPDDDRLAQCVTEQLCAVCGVAIDADAVRYVGVIGDWWAARRPCPPLIDSGAPLDERCARLTLAHCPAMKDGRSVLIAVHADDLRMGPGLGGGEAWHLKEAIDYSTTEPLSLRSTQPPSAG